MNSTNLSNSSAESEICESEYQDAQTNYHPARHILQAPVKRLPRTPPTGECNCFHCKDMRERDAD